MAFAWCQQEGADLGERLANALGHHFELGYQRVVIMNSDGPTLPLAYLEEAFSGLDHADVTLGPGHDGGYYLIGMKQLHPELFQGITWSTEQVIPQTLAICRRLGLTVHQLPEWYDVDVGADLERLDRDLAQSRRQRRIPGAFCDRKRRGSKTSSGFRYCSGWRAASSRPRTLMLSMISPSRAMRSASSKGKTRRSRNSVSSGGASAGVRSSADVEVGRLVADALGGVVAADVDQSSGMVASLFGQFPLGGLFQRLPLVDAAGGDLPAVVLALNVAVLAHQEHMVVIDKGHHAHAVAKGDHAIDGGPPVGHLGHDPRAGSSRDFRRPPCWRGSSRVWVSSSFPQGAMQRARRRFSRTGIHVAGRWIPAQACEHDRRARAA